MNCIDEIISGLALQNGDLIFYRLLTIDSGFTIGEIFRVYFRVHWNFRNLFSYFLDCVGAIIFHNEKLMKTWISFYYLMQKLYFSLENGFLVGKNFKNF